MTGHQEKSAGGSGELCPGEPGQKGEGRRIGVDSGTRGPRKQ
jgi:hypothetical protein